MSPISSLLEFVWSRHKDTQNFSDVSPKLPHSIFTVSRWLTLGYLRALRPAGFLGVWEHACARGLNLPAWNIGLILKQVYKLLFFLACSHHPPSPTLLHWWILSQTIESLGYIYAERVNFYPGTNLSWMPLTGWRSCLLQSGWVQEEKYLDALHLNKIGKLWHSSAA